MLLRSDLPVSNDVVVSDIVLKMDGKTIAEIDSAFLDPDSKEVQKILLANIWNGELEALPYYAAPSQSVEITFTVSGFANDAVVESAPVETAPVESATTEAAPADSSSNTTMIVIIVVVVVVVVAVVAGVIVAKKKKDA